MVEIGTTHNVGSSLTVQLVTLPDQHLTRPCLAECVLGYATGSAVDGVDSSVHVQCVIASRPILSRPCLLRPWYGCLSVVTYGGSSTMFQAEVPIELIHAFYWEMGPFIFCSVICDIISSTSFLSRYSASKGKTKASHFSRVFRFQKFKIYHKKLKNVSLNR